MYTTRREGRCIRSQGSYMFWLAVIIREHVSPCEMLLKIMKPIKLKMKFKTTMRTSKLTFRGRCIVMYSYNKAKRMHYFSNLFQ